jgi:D-aminopeptidase
LLQGRYDDPEVQGGKIALIAFKQNRAQKPPNFLDRMWSTFLKQVAYNQRAIEAETGVAGVNSEIPDFLSGMNLDPEELLVICVNGSAEMKREEEAIGGQLWMQSGRQMTASNKVIDGMANSRESSILSAVREAVTWRHVLEPEGERRKGQLVIIYPNDLPHLEAVLSTGDPNIDSADGHSIAYADILQAYQTFENPPDLFEGRLRTHRPR